MVADLKISLKNKKQLIKIVMVGVVFLILGVFIFHKYLRGSQDDATKEAEKIIAEISKTIDLPNETPVVATVSDKNSLSKQDFFNRAENGDKVLIYQNWQRAILYRPSTKKIIDLTNISTNQNPQDFTGAESTINEETTIANEIEIPEERAPANYRIALYNGSTVNGLTQVSANKLSVEKAVSIVSRVNASRNDYEQTLVIPLKNTSNSMAIKVAELLQGQVTTDIPPGETTPEDAEILVILAQPETSEQ